jgi:hypothetical protein
MSRERWLAALAKREEGLRLALEYPSGVMRPGGYAAHYNRDGCLRELGEIARERARLQAPRQVPATAPARRIGRPGRPAAPVHNRRKTLKLSAIIVVADMAVVTYVEKGMTAGHPASAGHHAVPPATLTEHIVAGLVFGSPILLVLLVAWLLAAREAKARAAASAPRSGYRLGQQSGGRL